jgi:hypothetical protein
MAIGWLTALQLVPWVDVITNAPKVADGAVKLWKAVGKKTPPVADPPRAAGTQIVAGEQAMAQVQARLVAAEAAIAELHGQMLASSELIKALSEQNTQLIRRVESNRVRVLWLAGAVVALMLGVVAMAVSAFLQ